VLVPCFLLFLCFGKVTQDIFLELDETKPEPPIFPRHKTKSEGEPGGGGRRLAHHRVARVPSWPHHHQVWGPWLPSDIALPPIKGLRRENPKSIGVFPVKFRSTAAVEDQFRGIEVSVLAPCWDGEVPLEPSPSTPSPPPPSPSTLLSSMMRRE
jgi:hypothetical protein